FSTPHPSTSTLFPYTTLFRSVYRRIYRDHARDYESLVAAEDREGNILDALQSIGQFRGAQVLEVGVGTGRITRLLAPHVARIHGDRKSTRLNSSHVSISYAVF